MGSVSHASPSHSSQPKKLGSFRQFPSRPWPERLGLFRHFLPTRIATSPAEGPELASFRHLPPAAPNWLCSAIPRCTRGEVPDLPSPELGSFRQLPTPPVPRRIGFVPQFPEPSIGHLPDLPSPKSGSFRQPPPAPPRQIGFVPQFVDGTPGPRPRPPIQAPRKPPLLKS